MLISDKHSNLLCQFLNYEENEVLWIWPQDCFYFAFFWLQTCFAWGEQMFDFIDQQTTNCFAWLILWPGNPSLRGRLSTVDLLVITSLDQLLLIMQTLCTLVRNKPPNEEVNRTEPPTSVSVPCFWPKNYSIFSCVPWNSKNWMSVCENALRYWV